MKRLKEISLKTVIVFLAFVMFMGFMPGLVLTARADDSVSYKYYDRGSKSYKDGSCNEYTTVTGETGTTWGTAGGETWYVVPAGNGTVEINDRITVDGTVNMIICDGAILNANAGITVTKGKSLNIYGQEEGTGELIAAAPASFEGPAGIGGGSENGSCGTVNIHGGKITATGGPGGAGIGEGASGQGGTVHIYGGKVNATGGQGDNDTTNGGAGIGLSAATDIDGDAGQVIIYGGEVIANGRDGGAGIGGRFWKSGGSFAIYGGKVTANGDNGGAGIGGGSVGTGGSVTIDGGELLASGGVTMAKGIGAGASGEHNGSLSCKQGVALLVSDDNESWSSSEYESGFIRKQYMKSYCLDPVSYRVTFKVENGSWNEGDGEAATEEKTVTLNGYEGETLRLSANMIPAVGMKPNDGYKAGSWDTIPSTETGITEDTTYVYTYAIDDSEPAPTPTPAPIPDPTPAASTITDGQEFALGSNVYIAVSVKDKTVAFVKAENKKSVTVPDTIQINGEDYAVIRINTGAFDAKGIRTVTAGRNVRTIMPNAFKGSKAVKLVIMSKKLTKKTVKGSLKGSKIKKVQVKVGKKKVNKKYAKKYKKIFTKKNAGRKVKVS